MEFYEVPHTSTDSHPMMLCDSMCVFHFRGLSVGVAAGETLEKFPEKLLRLKCPKKVPPQEGFTPPLRKARVE